MSPRELAPREGARRARLGWSLLAPAWVLPLVLAGCASSAQTVPVSPPAQRALKLESPVGGPIAGSAALVRWTGIDAADRQTQRLITLNYKGTEGDGTLRLALRMENERRFSLQGTDRLGRRWFRIAVDGDRALLLDLREKSFCWFEGEVEIQAVPLGPLSFSRLPALLLNRLPPQPLNALESAEGVWEFTDSLGQEWTARIERESLIGWTLWREDEPEVYWSQQGELSFLSARTEELQLRWKSSRPQALTMTPAELVVPEGYSPGICD